MRPKRHVATATGVHDTASKEDPCQLGSSVAMRATTKRNGGSFIPTNQNVVHSFWSELVSLVYITQCFVHCKAGKFGT